MSKNAIAVEHHLSLPRRRGCTSIIFFTYWQASCVGCLPHVHLIAKCGAQRSTSLPAQENTIWKSWMLNSPVNTTGARSWIMTCQPRQEMSGGCPISWTFFAVRRCMCGIVTTVAACAIATVVAACRCMGLCQTRRAIRIGDSAMCYFFVLSLHGAARILRHSTNRTSATRHAFLND